MKGLSVIKSILLMAACFILGFSVACSKKRAQVGGSSTTVQQIEIKSAGIMTSRQLFSILSNSLNVNTAAETASVRSLLQDYVNMFGSLPKFGDSGTGYTSTMSRMMSNFIIRGCQIAMEQDQGIAAMKDRVVFKFIDLNQGINVSLNADPIRWEALAKHLSYRFWGHEAPADELAVITSFIATYRSELAKSTVPPDTDKTRDLALMTCGLIGSSPRTLYSSSAY